MMSFCKKSVHSFLGFSSIPMNLDDDDNKQPSSSSKCLALCLTGGLGLVTATGGDSHRTPNVLESASLVKSCSSSSASPPPSPFKKDYIGGFGFIDDVGGGVNGLMSCTETLGFESSDERNVDDDDEIELCCSRTRSSTPNKWRKIGEKREVKKFPPLISSLDHNGQPSFFLRPVRKDGRLELTEVRIDRPEIFRAYREDGRLRLHLIRGEDSDINEETRLQDQEYEETQQLILEEDEKREEIEEEEEKTGREWKFTVNGEELRRCHELVTHHHDYHHHHHGHHHNLHVWSQHCVTTR